MEHRSASTARANASATNRHRRPTRLRPRWTYLRGSSRRRLPSLVRELEGIDPLIHDSMHTPAMSSSNWRRRAGGSRRRRHARRRCQPESRLRTVHPKARQRFSLARGISDDGERLLASCRSKTTPERDFFARQKCQSGRMNWDRLSVTSPARTRLSCPRSTAVRGVPRSRPRPCGHGQAASGRRSCRPLSAPQAHKGTLTIVTPLVTSTLPNQPPIHRSLPHREESSAVTAGAAYGAATRAGTAATA